MKAVIEEITTIFNILDYGNAYEASVYQAKKHITNRLKELS
jgi:hypothetical protein